MTPLEAANRQAQMLEEIASALNGIRHEIRQMRFAMERPVDCITATATHLTYTESEPVTVSEHSPTIATPPRAASEREGVFKTGVSNLFQPKHLAERFVIAQSRYGRNFDQ